MLNTLIDIGLFMALHTPLGITLANFVSTSAGMTFSFVVNGLFTFKADRLTLRHALLFLATTGTTMWLVQPVAIHLMLALAPGSGEPGQLTVLAVKVLAIGVSFVLNFLAYRFVVWPDRMREAAEQQPKHQPEQDGIRRDPRP